LIDDMNHSMHTAFMVEANHRHATNSLTFPIVPNDKLFCFTEWSANAKANRIDLVA